MMQSTAESTELQPGKHYNPEVGFVMRGLEERPEISLHEVLDDLAPVKVRRKALDVTNALTGMRYPAALDLLARLGWLLCTITEDEVRELYREVTFRERLRAMQEEAGL